MEYLTASAKLEKLQRDLVKMYRGRVDQLEGVEKRLQDELTRVCLVPLQNIKFFKNFCHIEFLDAYMKH